MLTRTQIAEYHEIGAIVVPDILSADEVLRLRRVTDEFVERARDVTTHNEIYDLEDSHTRENPRVRRIKTAHLHHPEYARLVRHPKIVAVLQALWGPDIRFDTAKLNMKSAGFGAPVEWHQDWAFYPHTNDDLAAVGVMFDDMELANGPLMIMPGSHRLGYLGLSDDGPIMVGQTQDEELRRAGLDPSNIVTCEMEPGDLLLWTLFTVHGSAPNVSDHDRRFMINSYVRARDSERGEWAFRDGVSTALGDEPQICKYEQLRERPGPFYVESDWTEEAKAAAFRVLAMPSEARK